MFYEVVRKDGLANSKHESTRKNYTFGPYSNRFASPSLESGSEGLSQAEGDGEQK